MTSILSAIEQGDGLRVQRLAAGPYGRAGAVCCIQFWFTRSAAGFAGNGCLRVRPLPRPPWPCAPQSRPSRGAAGSALGRRRRSPAEACRFRTGRRGPGSSSGSRHDRAGGDAALRRAEQAAEARRGRRRTADHVYLVTGSGPEQSAPAAAGMSQGEGHGACQVCAMSDESIFSPPRLGKALGIERGALLPDGACEGDSDAAHRARSPMIGPAARPERSGLGRRLRRFAAPARRGCLGRRLRRCRCPA